MQLAELVRRIRHGEKEAVKELVASYGNAVFQRAFERTGDRELAREAARQTFGQFVAIVQQQSEDDGWTLWFGDLIERNISTYAQISTDMRTIESELDHEIITSTPVSSPFQKPAEPEQGSFIRREPEPARREDPETPPWRIEHMEHDVAPVRAQESSRRDKRAQKAEKRANKSDQRIHRDSVRDEIFDEQYRKRDRGGAGHTFSILLLILVSLLLLWVVAGVAMTLQWIPYYDLGFTWFNQNVFKLF